MSSTPNNTPDPTYARLAPAHKALLAELEETRRDGRERALRGGSEALNGGVDAKAALMAADYVIRAATGDVLADDDVRLIMQHALEEVGS